MLPRHGSYGGEIIQTIIDNAISEEFKVKVIVILAGYEDHITQLFELTLGFSADLIKCAFSSMHGLLNRQLVLSST